MVMCEKCGFFIPVDNKKGTCNNQNSVFFESKVSKFGRCWKGASK